METSIPLASDSFSYSWLSNSRTPLDEPQRELSEYCNQSFNFDTCISHPPIFLVHADEIFSDGFLMPVVIDHPFKVEFCNTPDPIQTKTGSSFSSRKEFLRRWRKSTWRALIEFFNSFYPLRQKIGSSRKSTRVEDSDKKDWKLGNLSRSSQKELHDHHENSIYEAVLHCKRSIGK